MTTKLRFLWVLLALLVGSVNEAWADTVTFGYAEGNTSIASIHSASNPSVTSGVVTFTASGATSGSSNVTQNDGKLKFQQNTYLTISVSDDYIISQIVITNEKKKWELNIGSLGSIAYSGDNDKINTWTGSAQSVTFINSIASDNLNVISVEVTYAVDSRKKITRFSPEGGYNSTPSFVDNVPSSKTVSCNFAIEKDNNDKLADATLHVTSSNTDIITITSVNTQNASSDGRQRITVVYNIVTEGEAYINYVFDGDENYQPTSNSVKITTKSLRLNTYSSYPFIWDFANNSWESSKIQIAANTTDWTLYDASNPTDEVNDNARPTSAASNQEYSYVDMVAGLKFTTSAAADLCLDWMTKWVWLNGKVTLPALLRGHQVTIVSDAAPTDVSEGLTLMSTSGNTRVYRATTAIALPEFTFGSTGLYSIDVRNSTVQLSFRDDVSGYCRESNPTLPLPGGFTNYLFDNIPGIELSEYTVTTSPSGIFAIRAEGGTNMEGDGNNGNKLVLTAASAGTSHVTVAINPTGEHAFTVADTYEFDVTVVKGTQTLSFADATKTITYGDAAPTNTLTQTGDGAVTYTSSDENVATVASDGTLTIHNSGTCTITAMAAETANYNAVTASYTLTVNGTAPIATIAWDTEHFPLQSSISYGQYKRVRAVATAVQTGSGTVQYKSSNTSIATVTSGTYDIGGTVYDCCIVTSVAPGTVTITAYVEGSGTYYPVEVTHQLTIIGAPLEGLGFLHESGKVKVGQTLTPYVKIPNVKVEDLTSVTVEVISGTDKIKVGAGQNTAIGNYASSYTLTIDNGGLTQLGDNIEGHDLQHLFPTILGVATGDATIRLSLYSDIYQTTTATYNVKVTNDDLNFAWAGPTNNVAATTEYSIYTGDYMMMPAISGNANGNWDYSKGTTCQSKEAYLYGISSGNAIWNYADFKVGEGYPNYRLTESNDALTNDQKSSMTNTTNKAYILWASSQNTSNDTLMIYAKTAGTVYLHAFDSQTGAELSTRIKINILDKSTTLASTTSTYASTMTFPYTWDFTKDIESLDGASPNYWEPHYNSSGTLDYYICGYSTMFNWDYCDEDNDGSMNEAVGNKYFVDENGLMPQFYAMTIFSGNSGDTNTKSYESKHDKLRYYPSRGDGQPHLSVVGGVHYLRLNNPGSTMSDNFKLVIKAKPTGDKCTFYKFKNGDHGTDGNGTAVWKEITSESIVMFDMASSEVTGNNYVEIGIDNVDIYWIAMSTEVKAINTAAGATGTGAEQMATYSYDKAMDFSKSKEVNNVDVYIATGVDWNDNARNLILTMTMNNGKMPARTGVVLRKTSGVTPDVWTFANGVNTESGGTFAKDHTVTSNTMKSLSVASNKFGQVKYEDCSNVTVDGTPFTKCLNLEGNFFADKNCRYVKFSTSDPVTVTIIAAAEQSSDTKLRIGKGTYNALQQLAEFNLTTSPSTYSYTYSGDATDIFIYSYDSRDITPDAINNDSGHGYGMKLYSVNAISSTKSAYMIADAQNEADYTAPSEPATNHLLSTWATGIAQPTLYRNAGDETGTSSGDTHIPFIFSSQYTKNPTEDQYHDAGYFSFWRIKSTSITAGKNMAYLVLDKATYGNAANGNGKAADITSTMNSSGSRVAIRFIDDDQSGEDLTGIEMVETEGVQEMKSNQGDGYYYDLRGQRVDVPTKGLYIHSGKKIYIK